MLIALQVYTFLLFNRSFFVLNFELFSFKKLKTLFTALIMFRYMSEVSSPLTNTNVFITMAEPGSVQSLARLFIFKTVTQYTEDNKGWVRG